MRKCYLILSLLAFLLTGRDLRADTYQLLDGKTLAGEILQTGANEQGIQVKVGEGQYEKVAWTNFSQPDLKKFQSNPKLAPLVEPYIEVTQEERIKKTEVVIKPVARLERPPSKSLLGSMFSSGLGWFIMLSLYAAVIYAGYEVAIFRAQPVALVMGLSAIPFLGFFAPIAFLAMKTQVHAAPGAATAVQEEAAYVPPPEAASEPVNPMAPDQPVAHPSSLHLADEPQQPAAPQYPPTVTFQRGQFTFNRRFIETKFPGFIGVIKREADKDMVLLIKAIRGDYIGERISSISANEMSLEVRKGDAAAEVTIPYPEIREIQLKHRDAP